MLEESNENDIKDNVDIVENQTITEEASVSNKTEDKDQVLIKTETKTGYVNIDGTEREKVSNESNLKERMIIYYNASSKEINTEKKIVKVENKPQKVEVDDIIVPQTPEEVEINLPSTSKGKEAFKLLPKVIQDFLNSDWKTRPKCEPQRMLERIRKEKLYPEHPHTNKYELLLTPAQSFLQRISLAGEFLNRNHMEL